MWITKVAINNPVFATMVMVGLCVLGLFAYSRLGVEQLPDITTPTLTISVAYPGASPEAVENDITKPIENAVNTISGIKLIRSNSSEGDSETYVEFRVGTDINRVIQDVRDRVAEIRPSFPREAKDPLIIRADSESDQPVVTLAVVSSSRNLRDLSTLTEQLIVKELQKSPGVGRVIVNGGRPRQVQIRLKPAELAAFRVGVDQVMDAIRNSNQEVAAGRISDAKSESLVRVEGRVIDVSGFNHIIVARRGVAGLDSPVYLSQVADVVDGEQEAQTLSRLNGEPSIGIDIFKVQDANVVETGDGIKSVAAALADRLPPGVRIHVLYANSDFVKGSLDGVKHTLIEGGLLTVFIVFLFLRSWRSTVITGLTLPIAVISTFIALYAFNFTLNFMTMMALSLCIGLLIDDAIVVRENIVRHLRMGKSHATAAREGTEEIGLAVMATTFAIVAVFTPVAFMSGIIGKFFYSFGITVTVAVLVSLFVSFTLDPMLSSVWYDPAGSRLLRFAPVRIMLDAVGRLLDSVHRSYGRTLEWSLAHRRTTLSLAVALFVGSLMMVPLVGTEFIPKVDESFISLRLTTPVGASLQFADQKARQVEDALRDLKEIEDVDVNVYGEERGVVRINLKLVDRRARTRSQADVEKVIRERLSHMAGIETTIGYGTTVFISILGPDVQKLNALAEHLAAEFRRIPGIVDLTTSMRPGTPALSIKPRADALSDAGLTTAALGNVLRPLVAGETVGYWLASDGQNYEVRLQLPPSNRTDAADIGDLMVTTNRNGPDNTPQLVPLRQVATIGYTESPQIVKRQNLQRRVAIYANTEGRPAGDVGKDIEKLVKGTQLPPGYFIDIGGAQKDQNESSSAAGAALLLAVIFIYLILASQFGSFLQPIAIMMSLPFSLIGVILALWITRTTLNIFSIIGFIMLMGLVTKNAILLVDFANQGQREGKSQYQALLDAGQVRLRPILMTTAAIVFGMLPLALGLGEGSEQQSPMGRAIIGGVLTSTLLTLVVVPVVYSYLDSWGKRVVLGYRGRASRRRAADASGIATAPAPSDHGTGRPAPRQAD